MPYIRDRVFILKKEAFRERDRRYFFYGYEHGLLTAVANGVSKPDSKQAGHLEPFTEVEIMIAQGRAYDKLAVARNISSSELRTLSGFIVMGGFTHLLLSLLRPGVSDARIFDLLLQVRDTCSSLNFEPSTTRTQLILAGSALKLMDILGYAPSITNESGGVVTLLKFLRHAPLKDALRVTAETTVLEDAARFVDNAMQHTDLLATNYSLLTS